MGDKRKKSEANKTIVAISLTGGGDCGGGWYIVGGQLKKVGPRDPSIRKISAAVQLLDKLEGIKGVKSLEKEAGKIIESAAEELVS